MPPFRSLLASRRPRTTTAETSPASRSRGRHLRISPAPPCSRRRSSKTSPLFGSNSLRSPSSLTLRRPRKRRPSPIRRPRRAWKRRLRPIRRRNRRPPPIRRPRRAWKRRLRPIRRQKRRPRLLQLPKELRRHRPVS